MRPRDITAGEFSITSAVTVSLPSSITITSVSQKTVTGPLAVVSVTGFFRRRSLALSVGLKSSKETMWNEAPLSTMNALVVTAPTADGGNNRIGRTKKAFESTSTSDISLWSIHALISALSLEAT